MTGWNYLTWYQGYLSKTVTFKPKPGWFWEPIYCIHCTYICITSLHEIAGISEELGDKVPDSEIEEMITEADSDGDGKIQFEGDCTLKIL